MRSAIRDAAVGIGLAALILKAAGVERQPLLRGAVPLRQVPARLPQSALCQQGACLPVPGGIRGLVRPSAPPQRDQVCDPGAAAQRSGPCHLPSATQVYVQARQRHPRRWPRPVRCWPHPIVAWINKPPDDTTAQEELLFLQAA